MKPNVYLRLPHFFLIILIFICLGDYSANSLCLAGFLGCSSPTDGKISDTNRSKNQYSVKLTVLYDNTVFKNNTTADWGFSCLLEGMEDTILFDTGTQGNILQHNIDELNIDISDVDQIVLSHNHQDHTGGIWTVLGQHSAVMVHLLSSFDQNFIDGVTSTGASVRIHQSPDSICRKVHLSGELGQEIKEHSMILDTDSGLVVITGCSHPGIVNILERAQQIKNRPIYLVLGGFHLMNHSHAAVEEIINDFLSKDVKYVAPTHCTGESAISMFEAAFGNHFIQAGTGRVINIP